MGMQRSSMVLVVLWLVGCGSEASRGYSGDHGSSPEEAVSEAVAAIEAHAASPAAAAALSEAVRHFPRTSFNHLYVTLSPDGPSFAAATPSSVPGATPALQVSFEVVREELEQPIVDRLDRRLERIVGTHQSRALLDADSVGPAEPGAPTLELTVHVEKLARTFETTSTPSYTCDLYRFRLRGTLTAGAQRLPIDLQLPEPPAHYIEGWQSQMEFQATAAEGSCRSLQITAMGFDAARAVEAFLLRPAPAE